MQNSSLKVNLFESKRIPEPEMIDSFLQTFVPREVHLTLH